MKLKVGNLKIFLSIFSVLLLLLVGLLLGLPKLLHTSLNQYLISVNAKLASLLVEQINPWAVELSDTRIIAEEGNFSFDRLGLRFDPLSLSDGKVHAASLSAPMITISLPKIYEILESVDLENENSQSIQSKLQNFLEKPPLQYLRIRDANLRILEEGASFGSALAVEGDFHTDLAKLRLDANTSGFTWMGDVTMVNEGNDLFLGASLHFPDLSTLSPLIHSLSLFSGDFEAIDLEQYIQVEEGTAKGQWTGRMEDDGIIDQFLDFNSTNLVLQCMGMTLEVPQAILFITPRSNHSIESNFYANIRWGDNLKINGLKISLDVEDGKPGISCRIERLQTGGILPHSEIVGLTIDEIEFAYGENDEFLGLSSARVRFSAIHLEEGLYNLYDGEIEVEWLGEDRFRIEMLKANGSIPTIGLNLHKIGYEGEIVLDRLPKLETKQSLTIEEAFLGEDQKMEDLKVQFQLDSAERIEFSEISLCANDFKLSLDPANLVVEWPEVGKDRIDLSWLEGEMQFPDYEDFSIRNIQGNIKLNTLDPLESNGSQNIRFDLHAGEQVLEDGWIRFNLLPSGKRMIQAVELKAFDGLLSLKEISLDESLEELELNALATGLNSQSLINLFEDLDARMDGNLSGMVSLRKDPFSGWDFYGGSLSLDPTDSAKLFLNTQGILTDGLEEQSPEYKNMYLLDRALQNLNLEDLTVLFSIQDNDERVVEMNVRGDSEVDGKAISVEYRPKIVGGLDALIQQADLSKWGITP